MKAGVVHAKDDLRVEDIPLPQIKENEVLIQVAYTGICGSDIPRVLGEASHYYPNVLGHEFSGIVKQVGKNVSRIRIGQHVAGVPLVPCMKCEDCRQGNYALCKHYSFIGSRQYGSFAEYVAVPETNVVVYDDSVSFEKGALFEPATIALHGLERIDVSKGKHAAILGGGTIGLLTMQWVRIKGSAQTTVFDIDQDRLNLNQEFGADHIIDSGRSDYREKAMEVTDQKGFDLIFETSGSEQTIKMALELAASQAQISFIGTPKKDITFSVDEWEQINRKELRITGSWMSYSAPFPGHEWQEVAEHFKKGDLKYNDSLIFKKFPLSEIREAFDLYKKNGAVKGKILIDSRE